MPQGGPEQRDRKAQGEKVRREKGVGVGDWGAGREEPHLENAL